MTSSNLIELPVDVQQKLEVATRLEPVDDIEPGAYTIQDYKLKAEHDREVAANEKKKAVFYTNNDRMQSNKFKSYGRNSKNYGRLTSLLVRMGCLLRYLILMRGWRR